MHHSGKEIATKTINKKSSTSSYRFSTNNITD